MAGLTIMKSLDETERSDYRPPVWFKDPHVQTLINSRIRKPWLQLRSNDFESVAKVSVLPLVNGTRLKVVANLQKKSAPTVVILAGLFGDHRSSYVLSAAQFLWQQGFSVVRLVLRDHGDTAHLNRGFFCAANIDEVAEALSLIVNQLSTGETGVLGFSMGGNISLRLNMISGQKTLAVCPVLNPAKTAQRIDQNWYFRRFFIRKWRRIIRQKLIAFPDMAGLADALEYSTLNGLTRYFVERYSIHENLESYYSSYSLTPNSLIQCSAAILCALDDPIVPASEYERLNPPLHIKRSQHGGHCAFLTRSFQHSWLDEYAVEYFWNALTGYA